MRSFLASLGFSEPAVLGCDHETLTGFCCAVLDYEARVNSTLTTLPPHGHQGYLAACTTLADRLDSPTRVTPDAFRASLAEGSILRLIGLVADLAAPHGGTPQVASPLLRVLLTAGELMTTFASPPKPDQLVRAVRCSQERLRLACEQLEAAAQSLDAQKGDR